MRRAAGAAFIVWLAACAAAAAPRSRGQVEADWALLAAARRGDVAAARAALGAGARSGCRGGRGATALMQAAGSDSLPLVRMLLEAGADAGAVDRDGRTALDYSLDRPRLVAGLGGGSLFGGEEASSVPAEPEPRRLDVLMALLTAHAPVNPRGPEMRGPLHTAVWEGSLEAAALLLRAGASPAAKDRHGDTALHVVSGARGDRLAMARLLIASGADVDALNARGMTPLMTAVDMLPSGIFGMLDLDEDALSFMTRERPGPHPNGDLVSLLVQHGARLGVRDHRGRTPLMLAARYGDPVMLDFLIRHGADPAAVDATGSGPLPYARTVDQAKLLLAHGAEIEARDDQGRTPLIAWARRGSFAMVTELLGRGVELEARDPQGMTALMHAALASEEVFTDLLHAGADPRAQDLRGRSVLMHASHARHTPLAEQLIELGVDVRRRDADGLDALMHFLADSGAGPGEPTAVVEALLRRGADPRARSRDGRTPLALAAKHVRLGDARLLLRRGADPNAADALGRTPLMLLEAPLASCEGPFEPDQVRPAMVRLLVKQGARVNARDRRGWTPLIHFVERGVGIEACAALLQAGADPNLADLHGVTALAWAARWGQKELAGALRARGARVGMVEALLLGDETAALGYLARGENPNARGPGGFNLLTLASERGCVRMVRALLERGARANARQPYGYSPLIAAVGGRACDRNPDGRARDPLMGWAEPVAEVPEDARREIVELLLAHGARADAPSHFHATALHWAVLRNQPECARALLAAGADPRVRAAGRYSAEELAADLERWEIGKELRLAASLPRSARRSPAVLWKALRRGVPASAYAR
jgi:ankyrin repeat protein